MDKTSSKKLVLIVEDDAFLAEAWMTSLECIGYEVTVCPEVGSGIEAYQARWPDLIVLDGFFLDKHGIPKGDGAFLFCSEIAQYAADQNERLPPIIGVTGTRPTRDFPIDVFSSISLEVMPTRMRKPFAPDALVYEVERVFA